jgi:colanic acid biosynthesis glycosyl transferase WcaI
MKIVFVNRFYWPAEPATAQLLGDLAEALASRGYHVAVVTGLATPIALREETRKRVTILRVGPPIPTETNLIARAWHFTRFHLAVLSRLPRVVRRGDIVVALTDPPLLGVTVALAARLRGVKVVHWVQDIYPELLRLLGRGLMPKLLDAALQPIRNATWHSGAACVTLGQGMAERVSETGVDASHIRIIENWAPQGVEEARESDVTAFRARWEIGGRFVIAYSGNLGRVHDLDSLIEVADQLRSEEKFLFLFIGHGAAFSRLARDAEQRKLPNVRFIAPRPRHELAASLRAPDLHIVSLRAGCERLVFPSKLYGIAAAGRPIVFLGPPDSQIARAIVEGGFGSVCRPEDVANIVAQIRGWEKDRAQLRQAGTRARHFHELRGGRDRAAAQWDQLLRALSPLRQELEN